MCVAEETNDCEAARRFSVSEKLIRGLEGTGGKLKAAESGRGHIGTRELSAGVRLHETDDAR